MFRRTPQSQQLKMPPPPGSPPWLPQLEVIILTSDFLAYSETGAPKGHICCPPIPGTVPADVNSCIVVTDSLYCDAVLEALPAFKATGLIHLCIPSTWQGAWHEALNLSE